ncbi:hypothetical protein VA7868_00425 [Vibrio aerogenes CECT 7868]|uniref:DUF1365 domain-containing protein n=1 Tax=Vibrio aerogenes CECT 7868 TaxID=1216006 RepID=A0A1M5VLN8_9VIBR|nr:DUF1365 family protein [Vibrio aerogenes]SHH75823.1 hypothetical protein VA7868_00425 [Vibrio aerogenes CECT 7868]
MEGLNSQLMIGRVRHRRHAPVAHSLDYPLFMPWIDLDELPVLSKKLRLFGFRWWHWARFRREDYLGTGPLKSAVIDCVNQQTGAALVPDETRVMALIHLRYLGIYFSPVNFYYVFDRQGNWLYMLAEVSNTPWNERHYYVLTTDSQRTENICHPKAFHVSPFNPVNQTYRWRLKRPGRTLTVHLECIRDETEFDATLNMKSTTFSDKQFLKLLAKTPIVSLKILWGIYWHAFRLWRKGAPVYDHP